MSFLNKSILLIGIALVFGTHCLHAAEVHGDTIVIDTPLETRNKKKYSVLPTIWLYGGANGYIQSKYWKILPDGSHSLYNNGITGGIQTELILHDYQYTKSFMMRVGANVGYKFNQIATHKLIYDSNGINMHWITADIYMGIGFIQVGFFTDFCVSHSINNPDHYTYSGIYEDCLPKVVPGAFVGIQLPFPVIRFDLRFNIGFIPYLDTQKLAYYNGTSINLNQYQIEARIGIPLFIMSNKIKAVSISITNPLK